ncbi:MULTISPECIES: hypothetical protein [Bacillaceae]|uniref:Uncharacterized protein n=1 Tax=Domibacillus aminovorans TaxID=29332 RepID=A0A177KHN1_9BACI|nr:MULTISPECIES: hypothetical protein [Bacillaceae]OAH52898.1 hypothetical protein AWH48_13910 [Domibacillus aminovorans]OAH60827.1 hypothetical protein AWH49_15370 [Domibacillus aminovorans]
MNPDGNEQQLKEVHEMMESRLRSLEESATSENMSNDQLLDKRAVNLTFAIKETIEEAAAKGIVVKNVKIEPTEKGITVKFIL